MDKLLCRIRNNLIIHIANKVDQSLVFPMLDCCKWHGVALGKLMHDKSTQAKRRAAKITLVTTDSDTKEKFKRVASQIRQGMHTVNLITTTMAFIHTQ